MLLSDETEGLKYCIKKNEKNMTKYIEDSNFLKNYRRIRDDLENALHNNARILEKETREMIINQVLSVAKMI